MSENLNPRHLPHQLLMSKYSLSISNLSKHTQQLKKDLDRTLHLVLNKSKNGVVRLTPATQSKIETYDRYICDGIFEYLEDTEVISDAQANTLEQQANEKREDVKDTMKDMGNNPTPTSTPNSTENNTETPKSNEDSNEDSNSGVRVGGFWDWN
tara:strand:- start:742 stop:1203 length:462 start_codon:yes stop_codon:yes gene_type:complete